MIERVDLGFKEKKELDDYFDAFSRCADEGDDAKARGVLKGINKLLKSLGWVGVFEKEPFKILNHRGVVEEIRGALIFAPQNLLQEDLVNTSRLESARGFYLCFAPLKKSGHRCSFCITCGAQNLKEAQKCPAFKKLFKGNKARYHFNHYEYAVCFLRLVALFNDLPLQDFMGGVGSKQTFPRKADVLFLKGAQAREEGYIDKAIECYEKSAELGDVESFYELGKVYSDFVRLGSFKGCPNFTKALEYLKKAGEMGDTRAYTMLGGFYLNGKGVPVDIEKGLEYLNRAADMGSKDACFDLAHFYLDGIHVRKSPKTAEDYYNKALKMCQTKLEKARICYRIARQYMGRSEGFRSRRDRKKAVLFFDKAAAFAEEVFGAEAYDWMADMGWADYDNTQILEWYLKAIELGNTRLYVCVAQMYVEGQGCVQDYQKALEFYQKAVEADQENHRAYFGLAELYFKGEGVEQDYAKALEYYTIVAKGAYCEEPFYDDAFRRLSYMYDKGLGVTPDPLRAFEYLKKACGMWDWWGSEG
ncbi:hypothetical protein NHP21005_09860 [Helicobacter sp. NHP21005]|uniref:SEL1-like repeat protein n=1 Tax=Helicobacter felistomachi TaxID=3040201 RepID=UPI00257434C2|nr:SEL1-like repeat protein [Helicobacter sp. NHP21005]BEG57298.1 hypothetical protein NHP21005_09860 [Helicobacter sp. NHP21005]